MTESEIPVARAHVFIIHADFPIHDAISLQQFNSIILWFRYRIVRVLLNIRETRAKQGNDNKTRRIKTDAVVRTFSSARRK